MVVTQTETQSDIDRWSTVIALFAMVCALLSWAALNLEIYLVAIRILNREPVPTYLPELIEQLLWLCPIPVLILFRRIAKITVPYAFFFSIIFAGHCYYLLKFCVVGANAFHGAFQWTSLLQSIAGRISVAVIVFWMIIRLMIFLSDTLKNQSGAGSDG
jgi:TRAP-type uncharacterized transport system fused permease subunit